METKKYIDGRGWKYKVMPGIGKEKTYKARYQKKNKMGDVGWECMRNLLWRKTFDEAQADLDRLAQEKGWKEWQE